MARQAGWSWRAVMVAAIAASAVTWLAAVVIADVRRAPDADCLGVGSTVTDLIASRPLTDRSSPLTRLLSTTLGPQQGIRAVRQLLRDRHGVQEERRLDLPRSVGIRRRPGASGGPSADGKRKQCARGTARQCGSISPAEHYLAGHTDVLPRGRQRRRRSRPMSDHFLIMTTTHHGADDQSSIRLRHKGHE